MIRNIKLIFIQAICLVMACSFGKASQDPLNSTVSVKNFTTLIFIETESSYAVTSSHAQFSLPETPFQKTKVASEKNGIKTIIVNSGNFSKDFINNEKDMSKLTRDTTLLGLNSEAVKDLVEEYNEWAPKQNNPLQLTETFVFKYITNKTLGFPMLSAENIIEYKSGDCTEHAVLAIALLRAQGIPSRAVVGMLLSPYFNGKDNVFVFHMWAEAYYKGMWHLIDATRPGQIYPNRYIAFSYHNLRTAAPKDYMKAVMTIQNMNVEYIEK